MIGMELEAGPKTLQDMAILKREAAKFGLDLRDISTNQAALYAAHLIRLTPPFKTPGRPSEKVGQQAIKNDLKQMVSVISEEEFEEAFIVTNGNSHVAFRTKKGVVYGVENTNFVHTVEQLAPLHQANRSESTGRVSKAGSYTKNVGRWKFIDRAVVSKETFERYLAIVYAKVGKLASGWLPAFRYFQAKSRVPVQWPVPAFISRHATNDGGFQDSMNNEGDGFLKGFMNSRFGERGRFLQAYEVARRTRERDMSRNVIKRLEKMGRDAQIKAASA